MSITRINPEYQPIGNYAEVSQSNGLAHGHFAKNSSGFPYIRWEDANGDLYQIVARDQELTYQKYVNGAWGTLITYLDTSHIRTGTVAFSNVAGSGYADKQVAFDSPMSAVPVVAAIRTNVGTVGYDMQLGSGNVTKNGFTLRCWNRGANAISPSVSWIAIC